MIVYNILSIQKKVNHRLPTNFLLIIQRSLTSSLWLQNAILLTTVSTTDNIITLLLKKCLHF